MRAALRAGTIGVAAIIFAVGSAPDPAYTVAAFARALVTRDPLPGGSPTGTRLLFAALTYSLSALGVRRATLGAAGWMRSLPASGVTVRRAVWAAAVLSALPAACGALAAVALTLGVYHVRLAPSALAGLLLVLASCGAVALSVERRGTRGLAAVALVAGAWATWPTLAVAVAALAAWDRLACGLATPSARTRDTARSARGTRDRRPAPGSRIRPRAAAFALGVRWAWRAAGWRAWVSGALVAALPVAFAACVRANNPDLAPATRAWVARLGVGLGVVACVASGAAALLARRAPWPWARALPWSAAERVAVDTTALGAPGAGVGVIATLVLVALEPVAHPTTALAGAVLTREAAAGIGAAVVVAAVAAASAAAALRVGAGRQTGAVGELVLVAVPAVVALALRPALALAAPFGAVALGVLAVRRERRAAGAVRWDELRHDVIGDVGWITRV